MGECEFWMFGLIRTRFINMHDHIRYILLIYKSKILVKKTHSLNETVWYKFNRDWNRGSQPGITTAWTWAEIKTARRNENQRKLGQLFK